MKNHKRMFKIYIFKVCAAIWQDFWHPKNRCWHTQLNVCEKEELPCFLYLIQIFDTYLSIISWLFLESVLHVVHLLVGNIFGIWYFNVFTHFKLAISELMLKNIYPPYAQIFVDILHLALNNYKAEKILKNKS